MPLIHVDLIEGRTPQQLKALVKDITAAVVKDTGAPAEHVHIVLNEMAKNHYSVGGILQSDQDK